MKKLTYVLIPKRRDERIKHPLDGIPFKIEPSNGGRFASHARAAKEAKYIAAKHGIVGGYSVEAR